MAALRCPNLGILTEALAPWSVAFVSILSTARIEPFTANQETYLARADALAKDGAILSADWFVRTLDPVPVFTRLARPAVAGGPWAMWLVNAALGAVLLVAMAHGARAASRDTSSRARGPLLGWVALLAAIWVIVPGLLRSCVFEGLAGQRAYSDYLQPANAGVLFVAAVGLAFARRSVLAVLVGAAAAWLHPTYALSSIMFTAGVCIADAHFGERWQSSFQPGLAGLAAVAPPTLSSLRQFCATTSALAARAGHILVAERLPHHALIANWGTLEAALRLAPLVLALGFARGRTRLLLLAWASLALVATVLVHVAGQPELLLLFPWRASVWLIPASTALLLGHIVRALLKQRVRWLLFCLGPLAAGCGYRFARGKAPAYREEHRGVALAREIQPSERRRWTLLVPVDWEGVRLNAPAAVFVDFKSHPYKDVEVLAWWDRVQRARAIYASDDPGCSALGSLLATEPRLGFVLAPPSSHVARCAALAFAEKDSDGAVYRVRGRTSVE